MPQPRPRPGLTRRAFLQRLAVAGIGGPAAVQLLAACGSPTPAGSPAAGASGGLTIATPDNPVTWPLDPGNPAIADGLEPEKSATLRLYNYADYLNPGAVEGFQEKYAKYGVKVQVSTFNDTDEALTKIRTGSVPYDIYFPSYDQISKMVAAAIIRPLNHSYVPNIDNVWPEFQNPWYDGKWQYTVPYTVYTTGIGWRTDKIKDDIAALANPYDVFWDPKYSGQVAVIDDWHTAEALALLRAGITDPNTVDPAQIETMKKQLLEMQAATDPKVTVAMYNELPAGQISLAQMWSGDVVNAVYYLPEGTSPEVLGYWFPQDGKGLVDNDLMVVLAKGENPVLAHLFINYMLDKTVASENFSFIGYQPPQTSLDPDQVVADGYVPKNLETAVVRREWFTSGYRLLELPPAADVTYHQIWQQFKAGA